MIILLSEALNGEITPFGRVLLPSHPKLNALLPLNNSSIWTSAETETSRDLFRSLKAITIQDNSPREGWKLRECCEGEEELYFCDNVVIWSRSDGNNVSHLIKTFTLENRIIEALWCQFINDSNNKCVKSICALNNLSLEIFTNDGNHYPIALQFQVNKIVSTKYGLLLERLQLNNESNDTPLPIIFSLLHPLKEISPVIVRQCLQMPKTQSIGYITIENKLELVAVIEERSLIIFYQKVTGIHLIFILREANEEEVKWACSSNSLFDTHLNTSNLCDSPFIPTVKQSSLQSGHISSNSSPFRSFSSTKPSTIGISSSPSTLNPSSKSLGISSSSMLSPLRSSRLAVSPASPSLRPFGTPSYPTDSHFKIKDSLCAAHFSTTPRKSKDYDFLTDDIYDPIIPELSLDYCWSETLKSSNEKATKVFMTCDFMGQTYLALLMSEQQQLKLIKVDESNDGNKLIFGTINMIHAKDAEPIHSLNMILIVDSSNGLILYSGLHKTCMVQLPSTFSSHFSESLLLSPSLTHSSKSSLFQSPLYKRNSMTTSSRPSSALGFSKPLFLPESKYLSPVINESDANLTAENSFLSSIQQNQTFIKIIAVKNPVKDRITVESAESTLYRFSLPPISSSSLVTFCLNALKSVLSKEISMQMLIKWYSARNVAEPNSLTCASELNMFKCCLLSLIGYNIENLDLDILPSTASQTQSPDIIKKMKLDNEEGCDDDWNWLLSLGTQNNTKPTSISPVMPSKLFPYLPSILYSLHLVYEDLKLVKLNWDLASMLVDILYLFAVDLRLISYQDHYFRDFPDKCSKISEISRISEEDVRSLTIPTYFTQNCPSIYTALRSLVLPKEYRKCEVFPYIANVTNNIHDLILLFVNRDTIELVDKNQIIFPINITAKIDNEYHLQFNPRNIFEKIIILMNCFGLEEERLKLLSPGLSLLLWDSIFYCRNNPSNEWNSSCFKLIGRPDLSAFQSSIKHSKTAKTINEQDEDGISYLDYDVLKLLFPDDQRIQEAYSMLMSSKPVRITIQQRPGVSDHDFIEEQERHLYTICIRTMALPLGRGMLSLRSYTPVIAETFPIPKLNLVGRVPPRNNTIDLSHIEVPPNMNTWPLFHNGVAAGLRISPNASDIIDSSWIVYNRPKSSAALSSDALNEHAGFLLALGLNGHLACLSTMSIHDYLCKGNELTRVAVLLGLAAAKRGTMDVSAIKVLSIHVEALLPPTSTELDVPPIVQVAAVLGIGLLYQGSGHHHIAEVMLSEIGRPPGPEMEHYIDRESYALAAGLAFGLVTLGMGNNMIGLVSSAEGMSMADQLCHYMLGGHKRPLTALQREKYKTPSYQIREGNCINADVTSPGATLALGMMFFNSNNEAVAEWFTAPDTQHLLEMVRPDFMLLRALCKGLIMWSYIEPSSSWIESHIPTIVFDNAFQKTNRDNNNNNNSERIDFETMSQAYCNIVAGACFALGLKYAGSANQNAFKTNMKFIQKFIGLTSKPHLAEQAGRSTIESCLNVLLVSLAMIMAGTGNIEVVRICRYLRSRLNQAYVLYGSHMAIHMSLGLLFLAGCRATLSSTPEAVAALICAFFPKYPIHSNDNRYHLQAFRHLYVLATEARLVIPRDIDTGKAVYVNLHCVVLNKSTACEIMKLKAPCFLPELNFLEEVVVDDERYWRISFEKDKNWNVLKQFLVLNGVLYVKQKTGCLPYNEDPKGFKSLHAQSMMKDAVRGWSYKPNAVTLFSNDRIVMNFTKYLLSKPSDIESETELQQKLCALLFDCASNERLEFLSPLLDLTNIAIRGNSLSLWQIKFAISMSEKCLSLRTDFVDSIRSLIERRMKNDMINSSNVLINYLRGNIRLRELNSSLVESIVFYDLPPYGSLSQLPEKMSFTEFVTALQKYSVPIYTCITLYQLLFAN